MFFFNSGLFWFAEGILAVLVILGFKAWMEDRGVSMSWWKWILLALWVLLAGFTIAFVGASIGEKEFIAAFRGGLIFGLLTVFAGIGVWKAIHLRKKREK
jgi:hypothetical protein